MLLFFLKQSHPKKRRFLKMVSVSFDAQTTQLIRLTTETFFSSCISFKSTYHEYQTRTNKNLPVIPLNVTASQSSYFFYTTTW